MTQRRGFKAGKGDLAKKPPPPARKVTPSKAGKGKTSEAKAKKPTPNVTNPRRRTP